MIDTTSLNEPTRNICLVYTGRLDCNESRELNDFILGVGKFEIKRFEIVEYNIVVLLIKSTSAISYNEETILFSALSDRIRSGNIYYCITYLNSSKALISDKNERFFFTGQSLLNENGFVYYNEQDYINGKFSSFSSPYVTDFEFKSLKGDAVYSKYDIVAYLRVKYGNVELTEKQLADIGVISNMAFEHNMRIVSDIIIPETSHEHRLLGEEHFDDSALFADKNKYEEIKEISFEFFNLGYIDELKKMLEKKIKELSEKSDCMKNELNESLDLMELCDDAFGDRRSKLEDRIGFSYSNYPDISSNRDRFIVGNAGMLFKSSGQLDSGIYLHLVSPHAIENGEVLIPEGVTHIAKTAFKTFEFLPYSTSQRSSSLIRKIVFPSTFADDLYLDDFSSLEHLESIEVKSDKKVSLYFDESKRFKIAEFKRELKFPYNPQGDIIRKNRYENSITAQGCFLEIGKVK